MIDRREQRARLLLEFIAASSLNDCPSRISQLAHLTVAPAISLVQHKVKKKKTKTLDFEAGCIGPRCSISVLAQARRANCHGRHCTIALAHGRFAFEGGGKTLALTLLPCSRAGSPRP